MKIKFFVAVLAILIISAYLPVHATVDGIFANKFVILVDGKSFETWGYDTEWAVLHLTLHDMAYMLMGMASQFDIRVPPDERWDFWIVRGGKYTLTGNEFQPIPDERHGWWAVPFLSGDFYTGCTFYWPMKTLVIGIDGTYEPETTIALRAASDGDNYYFRVHNLAWLLGFELRFTNDPCGGIGEYVEGFDYIISTGTHEPAVLHTQTPEVTRLLSRLFGHWVDREHFFSEEIDESVVWPVEFRISHNGINEAGWHSVAPQLQSRSGDFWEWTQFWSYPVYARELGNGLVELTIGDTARLAWNVCIICNQEEVISRSSPFYNHRIVVDTNLPKISELTLFIGDTSHIMYRAEYRLAHGDFYRLSGVRHTATPTEGGGITLRYILRPGAFYGLVGREIVVMRSPMRGISGVIIFRQKLAGPYDRLIFEFTDTTVEPGRVYYYTMRGLCPVGGQPRHITPWGVQLRVDTSEILGEAEPEPPEQGTTEPTPVPNTVFEDETEQNASEDSEDSPRRLWTWLLLLPVCFGAWLIVKSKAPQ